MVHSSSKHLEKTQKDRFCQPDRPPVSMREEKEWEGERNLKGYGAHNKLEMSLYSLINPFILTL